MTSLVDFVERTLGRTATARDVRLPDLTDGEPVNVAAIWTSDGSRTRWDNLLAAVVDAPDDKRWSARAEAWRLQLMVLPHGSGLRVLDRSAPAGTLDTRFTSVQRAQPALRAARDRLFAPETLSRLRGELPLDLDITIGAGLQNFAGQQRHALGRALIAAISDAAISMGIPLEQHRRGPNRPSRTLTKFECIQVGHVTRIAVAYLGARVLEDKGFWPGRTHPTNDPDRLIREVTDRTNGFFKATRDVSLVALHGHHAALQMIAKHLGGCRSFALVDDQDIGDLYECALTTLPAEVAHEDQFRDLQQHYTPVGIARRMLEHLPLERIPAQERFVFDPAAGSGSLLLAATRRLAQMHDAPVQPDDRRAWLHTHVAGNDIDPRARMITGLRYTLVAEAFGAAVPFEAPEHFGNADYRSLTPESFAAMSGGRPRILVANPPYAEEREDGGARDVQIAAKFVESALSWLRDGDLFGLVLPQAFLTQRSHGVGDARAALSGRADVFECWQLREGIVGTSARQEVCVLLGSIGRSRYCGTVARKVQTAAEVKKVAHTGYLGAAWVGRIGDGGPWTELVEPPVRAAAASSTTVDDLYKVFCGPTPKRGTQPVENAPIGGRIPHFDLGWQPIESVSLDPNQVRPKERYRRRDELEWDARRNADEFPRLKLVAHNSSNRATRAGLFVFLDRHGYWPDHNVHCVVVRRDADENIAPDGWKSLTEEERLLWLLSILRSDVGRGFIEGRRSARHTNKDTLGKIPLPQKVSRTLIDEMRAWDGDRAKAKEHLERVNAETERSYGTQATRFTRFGADPQLREWEAERQLPTRTVRGHVAGVERDGRVHLHITGLAAPRNGLTVSLPQGMPGWALAGLWFEAALSADLTSLEALAARPWALREFRHPTIEELGSLAYSFLPLQHAPSPPPVEIVEAIRKLQIIEDERDLTGGERKQLDALFAFLEEFEEGSPRVRERRQREEVRKREIERLLGNLHQGGPRSER